MISLLILRVRKLVDAARTKDGRRALVRHRVVSTIEHGHLRALAVHTVIDVGANRGQFALFAHQAFPDAHIVCFEPGRSAFEALVDLTRPHTRIECHELALGDIEKSANLSITKSDDSSSLLVPTVDTQATARGLGVVASAEVRVERLDTYLLEGKLLERPTLLKIDVQGTELDVLNGAEGLLPRIDYVYVEVSFTEIYKGQALAEQVFGHLTDADFTLKGMFNPSVDAAGQLVQVDALFIRQA